MTEIFISLTSILLFGGLFTVILFNTDPETATLLTKSIFFISLLIFLTSVIYFVSIFISKNKSSVKLRRILIFSAGVVGLALFSFLSVLNIMSAITYMIVLVLIELFLSSKKTTKNKQEL